MAIEKNIISTIRKTNKYSAVIYASSGLFYKYLLIFVSFDMSNIPKQKVLLKYWEENILKIPSSKLLEYFSSVQDSSPPPSPNNNKVMMEL